MADATPPSTSGINGTPIPDSSPKHYTPQFSAATEMILKRIQSGSSATIGAAPTLSSIGITGTPPGYEDMRRNVLLGMKTTLNMEMPAPSKPIHYKSRTSRLAANGVAGSASAAGSPIAPKSGTTPRSRGSAEGSSASGRKQKPGPKGKSGRGKKRKRASSEELSEEEEDSDTMSKLGGDSDSDDPESVTEFPKVTQSGRQIVKPAAYVPAVKEPNTKRKAPSKSRQEQALCKKCSRGHSPQNNFIVFCDGCNLGWHQACHDPPISEEMVKDETAPWFCSDCSRKKGKSGSERLISWQGRSSEEKRSFFNSLPHSQLVSLLMQATVLYPNIPIFPQTYNPPQMQSQRAASSDRRANSQSQQPFPPNAAAGLFPRAEAHPHAPINFIRKIHPGQRPPGAPFPPSQSAFDHASSAPPTLNAQGGEDSRESTPASPPYPKPGNGLMAKLGPDDEDTEWLVDDDDYNSFSHTIFQDGHAVEENDHAI